MTFYQFYKMHGLTCIQARSLMDDAIDVVPTNIAELLLIHVTGCDYCDEWVRHNEHHEIMGQTAAERENDKRRADAVAARIARRRARRKENRK